MDPRLTIRPSRLPLTGGINAPPDQNTPAASVAASRRSIPSGQEGHIQFLVSVAPGSALKGDFTGTDQGDPAQFLPLKRYLPIHE